jgi:putative membrane protein
MSVSDLPTLNATLNTCSAVLLLCGYRFIKQGRREAHRNCMIGALVTSTLFLISYVTYHTLMQRMHGTAHTKFVDPAWFRPFYLVILFTHLVGAIAIVPMVLMTVTRAARERFDAHKRIARWTWPLWMYVSVTGVVIYLLLYQIFPQR